MDLEVAMIYMQCVFTWFVPMFVLEVGGECAMVLFQPIETSQNVRYL